MTKLSFLQELSKALSRLPKADVEERLGFYSEMIEDRMEDGLCEEDAVNAVGSVDMIAAQILGDTAIAQQKKKHSRKPRRLKVWHIILLAVGSPLWVSLMIATFAVALSLFVAVWVLIICLWAAFAAVAGCGIGAIAFGIGLMIDGNIPIGIAMIAAGLVCIGLSIFFFIGCKALTKLSCKLTKSMVPKNRKKQEEK